MSTSKIYNRLNYSVDTLTRFKVLDAQARRLFVQGLLKHTEYNKRAVIENICRELEELSA